MSRVRRRNAHRKDQGKPRADLGHVIGSTPNLVKTGLAELGWFNNRLLAIPRMGNWIRDYKAASGSPLPLSGPGWRPSACPWRAGAGAADGFP